MIETKEIQEILKLTLQIAIIKELYKKEEISSKQFNDIIAKLQNKKDLLETKQHSGQEIFPITVDVKV